MDDRPKPLGGNAIKNEGFHVLGAKGIYVLRCHWCFCVLLDECEVRSALVCSNCNRIVAPMESKEMLERCYGTTEKATH